MGGLGGRGRAGVGRVVAPRASPHRKPWHPGHLVPAGPVSDTPLNLPTKTAVGDTGGSASVKKQKSKSKGDNNKTKKNEKQITNHNRKETSAMKETVSGVGGWELENRNLGNKLEQIS